MFPKALELHAIMRPFPGETVCGDAYVVSEGKEGTLIALADGLGHGQGAAHAANTFCEFVGARPDEPLERLLKAASDVLHSTSGAAAALIRVSRLRASLEFCGVGNIEFQSSSKDLTRPISFPGIVGRPIRRTKVFEHVVQAGDVLALHSDGLSSRADIGRYRGMDTRRAAEALVREHGKSTDDVGVVVFRI